MPKTLWGDEVEEKAKLNAWGDPIEGFVAPPPPSFLDRLSASDGLFSRLSGKVAEGIQAENPETIQDPATKEMMMRMGIPLAAGLAAPVTGGATLPLALAAAGGFTGEAMAQASELDRGARDEMSPGAMIAAPIVAGLPLGPTMKGAAYVGGRLVAARPLAAVTRGAFGGAVTGGANVIEQAIDRDNIDWGDVAKSAAWGTVFGATMGAHETFQATRAQQRALLALRKRTGNWEGSDLEFVEWMRRERNKTPASSAAPAEEAPVSPGQVQALPESTTFGDPVEAKVPAPQPPTDVAPVRVPITDAPVAAGPTPVAPPAEVTAEEPAPAAAVEPANMPGWARDEMVQRGLDPARPLNDIDTANPSVRTAVEADPTLSAEEKANVLATGSPKPVPAAEPTSLEQKIDIAPSLAPPGPAPAYLHSSHLDRKNPLKAVVAAQMPDGTVVEGKPGEPHALLDVPATAKMGFVVGGKFMSREEASRATAAPEAPPQATATVTPQGPKITPTPALDQKVSALADPKQLRVQREFLLDALKKAGASAPEELAMSETGSALSAEAAKLGKAHADTLSDYRSAVREPAAQAVREMATRVGLPDDEIQKMATGALADAIQYRIRNDHGEKITIEVPGDGTFKIFNTKEALKNFADQAKSLGYGLKAANPKATAPSPRPLAKVSKAPAPESVVKAAELSMSHDEARYVLNRVVHDGPYTVATDSRREAVMLGGSGGTVLDKDLMYGPADKREKYPNWKQVLPAWIKLTPTKISATKDAPVKPILVTTAEAAKTLNQVMTVVSEKANAVGLYTLGNGKLGFEGASPDFGDYKSDGVEDGMKAATAVNPQFLHDAITQARAMGNEVVSLYITDDVGPVVLLGEKGNFVTVLMPVRTDGQRLAGGIYASSQEELAAAKAKTTTGPKVTWMHGQKPPEEAPAPVKEVIDISKDKPVGKNSAGESLQERPDGTRYRMRTDRPDRPRGYPDFGGDLAPVAAIPDSPLALKEETVTQLDLLDTPEAKAPVLARLNQKITELEKLKEQVERDEEFPAEIVAMYKKRADAVEAHLDAVVKRTDALEEKSDKGEPEYRELQHLQGLQDQLYEQNEKAEGDYKAVTKDPLDTGIELINDQLEIYLARREKVEQIRVKAAIAGQMDQVPAGFTPHTRPGGTLGSIGRSSVPSDTLPPVETHALPADNPHFSQLPIQLPEMVQFFKMISGGKIPRIVESIRLHRGKALSIFRYKEGEAGSGEIELRADLFHLLSKAEKDKLLADAILWAKTMQEANPGLNLHDAIQSRFNELVKEKEAERIKMDPIHALNVFAHEIWHNVDFIPEGTVRRGNILGHIASLKDYWPGFLAEHPGMTGAVEPTDSEKAKLRRQAEKELRDAIQEITETITREVPIFKEIPITADHITGLFKGIQRDEYPDLYDWFARLDRKDKVAIVKQAMQGIVDERARRFNSRVQTGTQTVTETITRTIGEEPTPEAIRKRFDELLRAELRKRGLISDKEIKQELTAAIAWWHGRRTMPPYFKSAVEMFAEAGSILLNNPAALAKRAPTFMRALFNYLERKPVVKEAYEELQKDIKNGAIFTQRVGRLRESWLADEQSGLERDLSQKMVRVEWAGGVPQVTVNKAQWQHLKDTFNLAFNKHQGPIQSLARKHLGQAKADKLLGALKDYLYRQTAVEGLARQINLRVERPLAMNGLNHQDMAEYMFHQRIRNGDAVETANSQGWSPNTSQQRLNEMAAQMGPNAFNALGVAARAMRTIYEEGPLRILDMSGALAPATMKKIWENIHYVPSNRAREAFNPLDVSTIQGMLKSAYGQDATARIFQRLGSFQDIQNPYMALIKKAEVLTKFAYRVIALKAMRDYMLEFEPSSIEEAPMVFDGTIKKMVPKYVLNDRVGTLEIPDGGTMKGYYVPRAIWETMQSSSGDIERVLVSVAMKVLAPFKAVLTELNPGFWPVNLVRDVGSLALQMPHGLRSLRNLPRAHAAARATFSGKADPIADMLLSRMMVVSRSDPRGEHLGHPDEMNRWMLRLSKYPELWDSESKKIGMVLRFWDAWKRQGQILERTVKGAGMMELDRAYGGPAPDNVQWVTMPEWMKKELVNEFSGSPDFNERGRAVSIVELGGKWMFANAWLRGMESFYKAQKRDKAAFWGKFLTFVGLPALLFYLFEQGHTNLGMKKEAAEDERDQLRSIPERDKLRGFVFPMGWQDKAQGKVAYLVMPFPDQVRSTHAGFRKLLQTMGGDNARNLGLGSLLNYAGQDLPGANPGMMEMGKAYDYFIEGRNPYDPFRGKPVLDEDVFKAGQGGKELLKQAASNLTGGIVYRHRPDIPGETPTSMEEFLRQPVISNIMGRWVRVSNAGLTEQDTKVTEPIDAHRAQLRLVADEILRKNSAGEMRTQSENDLLATEPYITTYLVEHFVAYMSAATGPEMKDFMRGNVETRSALMQMWMERDRKRQERLGEEKRNPTPPPPAPEPAPAPIKFELPKKVSFQEGNLYRDPDTGARRRYMAGQFV